MIEPGLLTCSARMVRLSIAQDSSLSDWMPGPSTCNRIVNVDAVWPIIWNTGSPPNQ